MDKQYICKKCLTVQPLSALKQDAKKRKGVVKGLRQCTTDKCGSVVFYPCKEGL